MAEGVEGLRSELRTDAPDLLVAFASSAHHPQLGAIGAALRAAFPSAVLLGCGGQSVIGGGVEVEEGPGLSVTAGVLPGAVLHPVRIEGDRVPNVPARSDVLLLADPFTCDVATVAAELDRRGTGAVVGGLASGADAPGASRLLLGEGLHSDGAVGVAFEGMRVRTVVAQGCRPVGHPLFVTGCRDDLLTEVDGRPPMAVLQDLYEQGDARERALLSNALFLGLEMRPARTRYERGDFLVRNLLGADDRSGALRVAAPLREQQVVQFHVRDAHTAAEDLSERLGALRARLDAAEEPNPAGALLFSCLGRGRGLYGSANHDSDRFRSHLGDVPLGGFFCNGEIGPVEGTTFLHGYTSAFALFGAQDEEEDRDG